jgi:hypothetical protein
LHNRTGTLIFTGNEVYNFTEQGVDCNVQNCIITDNYFYMNGDTDGVNQAVQIGSVGTNNAYGIVANNIFDNVVGTDSAILFVSVDAGLIANNIIKGNNIVDGRGIRLHSNAENMQVIGNYIENLAIGISDSTSSASPVIYLGNSYVNVTTELSASNTYHRFDGNVFSSGNANDVARFESSDPGAYITFADDTTPSSSFFELGALGDDFVLKVNNTVPFKISNNGDKIYLPEITNFGLTSAPACLKIADSDGGGYTYCTALNGALSCSTTSCE